MCIAPSYVWHPKGAEYVQIPKACGDCWQCRSNRVNDYVGRALCEAADSDWVKVVTLTYAPRDDGADKVINPEHFQKFVRSLRMRKLKIRYLAVGEYGALKGRAHFHVILFGKGPQPQISTDNKKRWPNNKNVHIQGWPHGHVYVDGDGDEKSIRYACKYLQKGEDGQYWFSLSKKPPLGAQYWLRTAKRLVDQDVMPRGFEYVPPGGTPGRTYLLTGATRQLYLGEVIRLLREKNSFLIQNPRTGLFRSTFTTLSEWVQVAVEKWERQQHKAQYVAKSTTASYKQEIADDMLLEEYGFTGDETREEALYWAHFAKRLYKDIENGTRDKAGYET